MYNKVFAPKPVKSLNIVPQNTYIYFLFSKRITEILWKPMCYMRLYTDSSCKCMV